MRTLRAVAQGDADYPVRGVEQLTGRADVVPVINPARMYLARLGEASVPCARSRLDIMAGILSPGADALSLDWTAVRPQDVAALREVLIQRYLWTTANSYLSTLKGVLRRAYLACDMPHKTYEACLDAAPMLRGKAVPAGRHIEREEWRSFMATIEADTSARGVRDRALFGLAYSTGARREELQMIDVRDLDLRARTVHIAHAKLNRARTLRFSEWLVPVLAAWLRIRSAAVGPDGMASGALFTKIHPSGVVASDAPFLSRAGMDNVLRARVEAWGGKHFSWHSIRHTVCGEGIDAGATIEQMQAHLGHANASQTLAYLRPREALDRSSAVADLLPDPFAS